MMDRKIYKIGRCLDCGRDNMRLVRGLCQCCYQKRALSGLGFGREISVKEVESKLTEPRSCMICPARNKCRVHNPNAKIYKCPICGEMDTCSPVRGGLCLKCLAHKSEIEDPIVWNINSLTLEERIWKRMEMDVGGHGKFRGIANGEN